MNRADDSFHSQILNREIRYLWFGESGRALVMFPTSGGTYQENEDRGLIESLGDYINEGRLQVCCIEAFNEDSWSNKDLSPQQQVAAHDKFDYYLSNELFPMVAARAGQDDTVVYGASMGGYHAVNFACRHPEHVSRCIALSAMIDNRRLLDGHWDEQAYFHNPMCSVPNMDEEWVNKLRTVEWVVATGETDSLVEETRGFSHVLREKGIDVHSEIWPGVFGHDWPFWVEHLRRFLP